MRPARQTIEINASAGRGRHRVCANARLLGQDILISIWGGSLPHIGSVSITMPRPGSQTQASVSTTSSVYNFSGHKDEAVARKCAERISAACNRKTVAVAGIHIDRATSDDIKIILKNAAGLCGRLIKGLKRITNENKEKRGANGTHGQGEVT
jgi:gallate decarboxylase subunit D